MKLKIASLILSLFMLTNSLAGCGSKKKKDLSILSPYTLEEIVHDLDDKHQLDEIFENLQYTDEKGNCQTLEDLELEYQKALEEKNENAANIAIYKLSKMLLVARIKELSNLDIAKVGDNVDVITRVTLGGNPEDLEKPKVVIGNETYYLTDNDVDELNRLAINSENMRLLVKGYSRNTSHSAVYEALKRHLLSTGEIKKDIFNKKIIKAELDDDKFNEIVNMEDDNIKKLTK